MKTTLAQAAEVRLGRQRSPQFESGDHMIPYLRSANVQDGVLDLSDVKTMNFTPLEQSIFGLEPGDVLVTEGSGSRDTVGVSAVWQADLDGPVCFQNTLLRLRPRPGQTSGRYLAWWARHARVSGQIAAVSSGANILHIGSDGLKSLPLDLPSLEQQRRIADFLDDRVARIDQIIAARQAQLASLSAWADGHAGRLLAGVDPSGAPLGAMARIIDTEHKTAPTVPGGGHWMVGTGAIRHGRIAPESLRETDAESFAQWTVRGTPAPGDVLLTREAPVGHVALLEDKIPPLAIGQRVVLLKPLHDRLDGGFLRLVLMHGELREVIAGALAGSLHPHLNMSTISRLRIPACDLARQDGLGKSHETLLRERDRRTADIMRSVDLLQEYKQSLITAAVTGEFDVTTASTRIPGA